MIEYEGRLYAFAYEDGPLVELDAFGHMIRIVISELETEEILSHA